MRPSIPSRIPAEMVSWNVFWNLCETAPKWYRRISPGSVPKRHGLPLPEPLRNHVGIPRRNPLWKRVNPLPKPFRNVFVTVPRHHIRKPTKSPSQTGAERGIVGSFLPHYFMAKFLTVKEAAKVIGRSSSSIRRIIYPILEDDQHPDRPTSSPMLRRRKHCE